MHLVRLDWIGLDWIGLDWIGSIDTYCQTKDQYLAPDLHGGQQGNQAGLDCVEVDYMALRVLNCDECH